MRLTQVLAAVMAMSSTTVAFSHTLDDIEPLADAKRVLYGRQDNSANSNAPASTPPPQSSASATQSNKDDNKATTTSGGSKATTGKPFPSSNSTIDPRLAAGGISMVTPATLNNNYYKVGDYITFAWNYTSLSVTPTALDILATCTANSATYTIALNQSADQTRIVWDTKNPPSGQPAFITDNYELMIYDADSSVSAAPKAGYLAPYKQQFRFGMYTPQAYHDWQTWECPGCNGAVSHFEKMTITALLMTTGTTIGSLLYFSYTFGVW